MDIFNEVFMLENSDSSSLQSLELLTLFITLKKLSVDKILTSQLDDALILCDKILNDFSILLGQLTDETIDSIHNFKISIMSNKALILIKQNSWPQGIEVCNQILELESCNVKALYRRAQCRYEFGFFVEALSDLRKCLSVDRKNRDAIILMRKVKEAKIEQDNELRPFYSNSIQQRNRSSVINFDKRVMFQFNIHGNSVEFTGDVFADIDDKLLRRLTQISQHVEQTQAHVIEYKEDDYLIIGDSRILDCENSAIEYCSKDSPVHDSTSYKYCFGLVSYGQESFGNQLFISTTGPKVELDNRLVLGVFTEENCLAPLNCETDLYNRPLVPILLCKIVIS